MAMRVTQNAMANRFQTDVQSIYSKMARTQQQISDGRRVTRPSDDPFGASQIMNFDAQIADIKQYRANISDATSMLDTADSSLGSISDAITNIRTKVLAARNGTNAVADLASLATEIQQLKEVIRDGVNSQFGGDFIFSGTSSGSMPYPLPGNGYTGTNNVSSKLVSQGQTMQVNMSGESVLGVAPGNTFDIIDQLVLDVQLGNGAGMDAGLLALDGELDRVLNVRTDLGARTARLELMGDRMALAQERLSSARTEVADVDAAEAYMDFTIQQNMYQAALASGTRMLQTSILDFI